VPSRRDSPPLDPILGHLGARIRARRVALGFSAGELAARSGVSQRFLSDVEAGRANISVVNLAAIARALATHAADLLAGAPPGDRRGCVVLLGAAGAGKSTIGPRLAAALEVPYFELDELVAAETGVAVQELVAVHGDRWRRRLEFQALRRFLDRHERAVLALGGDVVDGREALEMVVERCTTAWLCARPSEHVERLVARDGSAPDDLRAVLLARERLYARADLVIETSTLGIEGSVAALVQQLAARAAARRASSREPR
jgi:XRE family aerobic/anaerobic benzoate catabolism transcriptional regulator